MKKRTEDIIKVATIAIALAGLVISALAYLWPNSAPRTTQTIQGGSGANVGKINKSNVEIKVQQ